MFSKGTTHRDHIELPSKILQVTPKCSQGLMTRRRRVSVDTRWTFYQAPRTTIDPQKPPLRGVARTSRAKLGFEPLARRVNQTDRGDRHRANSSGKRNQIVESALEFRVKDFVADERRFERLRCRDLEP
jgi:hypothetical protein